MGHEHPSLVPTTSLVGIYVSLDIRGPFGGHGLSSAELRY